MLMHHNAVNSIAGHALKNGSPMTWFGVLFFFVLTVFALIKFACYKLLRLVVFVSVILPLPVTVQIQLWFDFDISHCPATNQKQYETIRKNEHKATLGMNSRRVWAGQVFSFINIKKLCDAIIHHLTREFPIKFHGKPISYAIST